jgi:hypothetical protein
MAALSERKLQIVRTLVEAAPDHVVVGLHSALSQAGGDSALASVRKVVEYEAQDRRLRNTVLQPMMPMCVVGGDDPAQLVFPSRVLSTLWRGLKVTARGAMVQAETALVDYRPGESSAAPFDRLVKIAADGVRRGVTPEFKAVAEACDQAAAGGADAFVACLDLVPVVRAAIYRLPEWTAHPSEDSAAGARLAYRDAVTISEDAGPRFFQMISAQLPHPWMVLRVISAVMDRPTERYLAESELGAFGERLIADVDASLRAIKQMDLDLGPSAGIDAAKRVEAITFQTSELETCIDLSREQGWGLLLAKQRQALASLVEAKLRESEKWVSAALPTGPAKLKRIRRSIPTLSLAPDDRAIRRAMTLLTFVREVRSSASYGGFAAARGKTLEKLGEVLDHYVEEVLDLVKTGDADNEDHARTYLDIAADFNRLVRDDKAAELVRRRAASAWRSDPAPMAVRA